MSIDYTWDDVFKLLLRLIKMIFPLQWMKTEDLKVEYYIQQLKRTKTVSETDNIETIIGL